jgi:hypothetical protein
VTESEWLQCSDIPTLLDYLVDRASSRKFRLFGSACCRRLWPLLADERARNAVCLAERYADGLATEEEVEIARREMIDLRTETAFRPGSDVLSWAHLSWAYSAADCRCSSRRSGGRAFPANGRPASRTRLRRPPGGSGQPGRRVLSKSGFSSWLCFGTCSRTPTDRSRSIRHG